MGLAILLKKAADAVLDHNFSELSRAIQKVYNGLETDVTNIITNNYPALNTTIAYTTANQTFTSSTVAAVPELKFNVVAGKYYKFKFTLSHESASDAVGFRITITTPTFTTLASTFRDMAAVAGTGAEYQAYIRASGQEVTAPTVVGANQHFVAQLEGIITPTADGTIQLKAGNETGATAVILHKASMLEVIEYG